MKTPDEFFDAVRERLMMSMRESTKLGDALTFEEGCSLATNLAMAVTNVYRSETVQKPDA